MFISFVAVVDRRGFVILASTVAGLALSEWVCGTDQGVGEGGGREGGRQGARNGRWEGGAEGVGWEEETEGRRGDAKQTEQKQ